MQLNNRVYTKLLNDVTRALIGLNTSATEWDWCHRTNATYLDCPIAASKGGNTSMLAIVHNPATIVNNYLTIKVPHGHFEVKSFNSGTKQF